tara:strand:+ start:407 stop:1315 length:909 start_codon:yes stop_codon:yes gene_type:complete
MFRYEKIAIGCTLSSALYCFYNQIPMIYVERRDVHPFEFFPTDTDLSLLNIEPFRYDLKMPSDNVAVFGTSMYQVYEKILVILSLAGLVPFSNIAKSVYIDKKEIRVTTERNKVFNVKYNSILIFDDTGISGLSPVSERKQNIKTQVLDWFDVNLGSSHDIDYMRLDDEFIKDIFFYESKRPHVYSGIKDLVAISHLTPQEAKYEYQYSDTYARFKILKCLKKAGIRGAKNGKNPNYPQRSAEPFKWLSPKITFAKREIVPTPMLKYRNTKKIKFCYDTPEKIISENTIKINTYTSKLLNIL